MGTVAGDQATRAGKTSLSSRKLPHRLVPMKIYVARSDRRGAERRKDTRSLCVGGFERPDSFHVGPIRRSLSTHLHGCCSVEQFQKTINPVIARCIPKGVRACCACVFRTRVCVWARAPRALSALS